MPKNQTFKPEVIEYHSDGVGVYLWHNGSCTRVIYKIKHYFSVSPSIRKVDEKELNDLSHDEMVAVFIEAVNLVNSAEWRNEQIQKQREKLSVMEEAANELVASGS